MKQIKISDVKNAKDGRYYFVVRGKTRYVPKILEEDFQDLQSEEYVLVHNAHLSVVERTRMEHSLQLKFNAFLRKANIVPVDKEITEAQTLPLVVKYYTSRQPALIHGGRMVKLWKPTEGGSRRLGQTWLVQVEDGRLVNMAHYVCKKTEGEEVWAWQLASEAQMKQYRGRPVVVDNG